MLVARIIVTSQESAGWVKDAGGGYCCILVSNVKHGPFFKKLIIWTSSKLNFFCLSKIWRKWQASELEKLFVTHISDKGLVWSIYKELRLLKNEITTQETWTKDVHRLLTKEDTWMASKDLTKCSTSIIQRQPWWVPISHVREIGNAGKDVEQLESSDKDLQPL